MKYKINWDDGVFAVPDAAADCLKLASGKAVKVLLYILKNKPAGSLAEIGAAVGVSEEDAEDAVAYWKQVGVILPEDGALPAAAVRNIPEKTSPAVSDARARERAVKNMTPEEISERADSSEEVRFLLSSAESVLGKVLTHTEQRTLIWLYDYYGTAPDLLLMIIEFAKSRNKASAGFIEKIAEQWHNDGITTHEQAEREILRMKDYYSLAGQVQARLELNRTLTPAEKKYVTDWSEKGIGIELIVYAYEKTVDNIGKVKFSYMNKILLDWHEKGCFTPADVRKLPDKPRSAAGADKDRDGEHSYDLDLLVEHAMKTTPKL